MRTSENNVAVIVGYFNGEVHINDQLQSILKQSHPALHIFIFDDQSSPPLSLDAIKLDAEDLVKISVEVRSKNIGFANNFLNALASIEDSFEYFAFSDHDDIWREDKLAKAIEGLSGVPAEVPALYCARTEITDVTCTEILGYSTIFKKPPSFANALVQSIGGGNTMVFNKAARALIVASWLNSVVVLHDWWCYQMITGAGGHVVYDPEPCLQYRQHGSNLVGTNNTGWRPYFARIRGLLQGRLRKWNDINLKALAENKHLLTSDNVRILNDVIEARNSFFFKRLFLGLDNFR